mgnify:CR=1 FL=1
MVKEQRKPGSGVEAFRSCWQLEREKPAQRLCFGAEAEAEVLLEAVTLETFLMYFIQTWAVVIL